MSLYRHAESRYWWMYLEPTRQRTSTKIPIQAASPEQSRRNRQMAEALYHRTIAELQGQRHGLLPKPAISFSEHAKWYREHVSAKKRGSEREGQILDRLVKDFATKEIAQIDRPLVQEWMTARKASASTINREIDVLKHVLASAVPKYMTASPLVGLPRLRHPRGQAPRRAAILTPAQETRLLAVLTPEDRALVLLALCTLYRLSDLLDLKWADYHGTWIEARDTKTGRDVRVPVAKRARAALDGLRYNKKVIFIFSARRQGTAAVRRNRVKMLLRWACHKANVPYGRTKGGITFHSFRHTGATRMLLAGVDPRTVQEIGGWSSLTQVMRYTHPTEATKRRAVERI